MPELASGATDEHGRIITIERHILEEQALHPEATGVLTSLLYDLALAGKFIASKTTRAGLSEILGRTDEFNVQGEQVMKLDRLADETIFRMNDHTGRLAAMASEEHADILPIPEKYPVGKYILLYDPLDGSSNIDYNTSIGTIFAIYRRKSTEGPGNLGDFLQPGRNLVVAGYLSVWRQHDAGLYQRVRSARLYPRPNHRRVLIIPSQHPHPGKTTLFQRQPGQRKVLERRGPPVYALSCKGWKTSAGRCLPAISARWWVISTAICWPAASSITRPTPRTPINHRASCACSTRRLRWPSSPSRPAVVVRMAARISWISSRDRSTSAPRLYIGSRELVEKAEQYIRQYEF